MFNKRKQQDIGKARFNAQTEVKFREWYDNNGADELPLEYLILPNPAEIFEEDKARDKIIEIQDMNASTAGRGE